uniref:Uncharacterized protein n=1 Tax=Sparus aurata TaxID=8175 RepID=A0A671U3I0_SPAAU
AERPVPIMHCTQRHSVHQARLSYQEAVLDLLRSHDLRSRWRRVDSLGGGATPHTQLQVLLRPKGFHDAARRTDRQSERASALTHHQQRPDVSRSDLCVSAGTLSPHRQAVVTSPLAAHHRAVGEGGGNVIELGLVELLINTLTPVLKDDGDLKQDDNTSDHEIISISQHQSVIIQSIDQSITVEHTVKFCL